MRLKSFLLLTVGVLAALQAETVEAITPPAKVAEQVDRLLRAERHADEPRILVPEVITSVSRSISSWPSVRPDAAWSVGRERGEVTRVPSAATVRG